MVNNDILRKIRYIFDFEDAEMINLFASAEMEVTREQVSNWLKKEDHSEYIELTDFEMSSFLNGLINGKRGKREGEQPIPENRISNNLVLRKLKIALNLKDTDMIDIFDLADMRVSKHELSAFFRKYTQKQYRICKDQFMRNFLYGLQIKYRGYSKD